MKSRVILQGREYGKNGKQYTQYRITISSDIVEFLGWNKNDKIELLVSVNSKGQKLSATTNHKKRLTDLNLCAMLHKGNYTKIWNQVFLELEIDIILS